MIKVSSSSQPSYLPSPEGPGEGREDQQSPKTHTFAGCSITPEELVARGGGSVHTLSSCRLN
jgi:hypothetical protein